MMPTNDRFNDPTGLRRVGPLHLICTGCGTAFTTMKDAHSHAASAVCLGSLFDIQYTPTA